MVVREELSFYRNWHMIELRDYQQDLLVQMHRALAAATPAARIMLQLPTGSGKTRNVVSLFAGELLS